MSVKIDDDSDLAEVVLELRGSFTKTDLRQMVDQLDPETQVRSLRIDIATDQLSTVKLPQIGHSEPEKANGIEDDDTGGSTTDVSPPSRSDGGGQNQEESTKEDPPAPSAPRLQTDGNPYYLTRIIAKHGEWIRTKEIRDAIPADWDVATDTIGTYLWNLADRDLVEKRPFEADKRQTEYRITEAGEQALAHAADRTEETQPIEVEA